MVNNILFAGFGGQGILFAGKLVATSGLIEDKYVSWLPSYGPEMRGGTANCSVCVSDTEIASPIVVSPDNLIVMNLPSFEKFVKTVVPNGNIIFDSSLIDKCPDRDDVNFFDIPATFISKENGLDKLANIIILGRFLKVTGFTAYDIFIKSIKECVPQSKKHLIDLNIKAFDLGYNYN